MYMAPATNSIITINPPIIATTCSGVMLVSILLLFEVSVMRKKVLLITVASETLEGMFFQDVSVNMTHRKTMIGTKVKNYLCDRFQQDFHFNLN